jgi:DNA-binding PadR family transcriptional regulator
MVNFKGGTLTETTIYILTALNTPLHGYGIIKLVEQMTEGRIILGPGTLYGALQSLEKAGAIAVQGTEEGGRKRKTYLITPIGKGMLKKELSRLEELVYNIKNTMMEA